MTTGQATEILLQIRKHYAQNDRDDDALIAACNMLEQFPSSTDVYDAAEHVREMQEACNKSIHQA